MCFDEYLEFKKLSKKTVVCLHNINFKFVMFNCVFVTFPCGILGTWLYWFLIVAAFLILNGQLSLDNVEINPKTIMDFLLPEFNILRLTFYSPKILNQE